MYTFQIPKLQGMTEHVHVRETEPNFEKSPDSEEYGQRQGCDEETG